MNLGKKIEKILAWGGLESLDCRCRKIAFKY